MSDTLIASITSVVSLSIGWLLNEFGSWFKERRENKRISKNVLYHLLEIHYSIRKLDISKEINAISEITMRAIPKEEHIEGLKDGLNKVYQTMLGSLLEQNVSEELDDLEDDYLNSVESLSTIDPVLAYRLKGKTKILQGFDIINQSINNLQKIVGEMDATSIQQQEAMISMLKPEILQKLITDIEEEIIDIAKTINPSTRKEVNSMFVNYRKHFSENEEYKKYEQMIMQVVEQFKQLPPLNPHQ